MHAMFSVVYRGADMIVLDAKWCVESLGIKQIQETHQRGRQAWYIG
jgi:hypothetical protein